MKSSIIEVVMNKPFEEALGIIKMNIVSNGFLILNEINTTEILAKHGIQIGELKQLLFFHPTYMKDVLEIDPLLVNEVPLKFVVRSISHSDTSVSIQNPIKTMNDYKGADLLANKLLDKVQLIMNQISRYNLLN